MVMVALKCITHLLSVVVALVGEDGLQGGPERSSTFTAVRATQVAVFMWTNLPRLAFPRTKQKGTSNLRQRVGRKTIISMGSTSWAMTTSWAFLDSTSSVTWLRPNLMWLGLSPLSADLSAAISARRAFFSTRVSGMYLPRILKSLAY